MQFRFRIKSIRNLALARLTAFLSDSRSRPNRETGVPDSRFRPSRESGIPFPVSRPNREWGERELGISGSGPRRGGALDPPGASESGHVSSTPLQIRPRPPPCMWKQAVNRQTRQGHCLGSLVCAHYTQRAMRATPGDHTNWRPDFLHSRIRSVHTNELA